MAARPMYEWREPETPEQQAALDNVCAVIVRIVSSPTFSLDTEYTPGEADNRIAMDSNRPATRRSSRRKGGTR